MTRERWTLRNMSRNGGKREGWWGASRATEAFLDELVTWREIGFNMCARRAGYDRYDSLPDWARTQKPPPKRALVIGAADYLKIKRLSTPAFDARLVADTLRSLDPAIAVTLLQPTQLTREQMLYCLFRHTGAQLFRDLVMRVGERYLVRRLPVRSLYAVVNKIGLRLTQRSLGRAVSRAVPLLGAAGVAGYSWYDTRQVARTALDLFTRETEVEPARRRGTAAKRATAKRARRGTARRT